MASAHLGDPPMCPQAPRTDRGIEYAPSECPLSDINNIHLNKTIYRSQKKGLKFMEFLPCARHLTQGPFNSLRALQTFVLLSPFYRQESRLKEKAIRGHMMLVGASQVAPVVKNLTANAGDVKRCEFDPWVS